MQAQGSALHNQHVCLQELGKSIFQFLAEMECLVKNLMKYQCLKLMFKIRCYFNQSVDTHLNICSILSHRLNGISFYDNIKS